MSGETGIQGIQKESTDLTVNDFLEHINCSRTNGALILRFKRLTGQDVTQRYLREDLSLFVRTMFGCDRPATEVEVVALDPTGTIIGYATDTMICVAPSWDKQGLEDAMAKRLKEAK